MAAGNIQTQYLLTLPVRMAQAFERLEGRSRPEWFATSDPGGRSLGSGGGTANLLVDAWKATAPHTPFDTWLRQSRKLVLHAGGQSRRLPAYALQGKLLMPLPVLRWARGQRLDQSLLDVQLPDYQRVLDHAPKSTAIMISSGDVLLRFGEKLPEFPDVDVLGLGMWLAPEKASGFGVFFAPRQRPGEVSFFLQKPSPDKIRSLAGDYLPLVDTGVWLLSERAVAVMMKRCGWDERSESFQGGQPGFYELYAGFGLALGKVPAHNDAEISSLTCAVAPLPEARFFHFGTSAQMIESVAELQTLVLDESKLSYAGARDQPDLVTQNSRFEAGLRRGRNSKVWVESSVIPSTWEISYEHVLTGVPENQWFLNLPPGACLDFVPVGERNYCVRPYGFHDAFSGALGNDKTCWLGKPALAWLRSRGLTIEEAGLDAQADIQDAALFPVCTPEQLSEGFIQWLLSPAPEPDVAASKQWLQARRFSARALAVEVNLERLTQHREQLRAACLLPMWENFRSSVFFRLDLESTGKTFAGSKLPMPLLDFAAQDDPMQLVHDRMFRSAALRHRGDETWTRFESEAFAELRTAIVREAQLAPAQPLRNVQEDQIVWARSPVRFDLAGGWSDTPPYCLENGGRVLNLAVDLNGQPPIQVFARVAERRELVIRSIDLGLEERVTTFERLDQFSRPDAPFALPKAALALAGFLPRFNPQPAATLQEQLDRFGGGVELSLLSAVPKGSGLGTSSILAATVLAALGDLCGLGWDRNVLFTRTLALEQMLTTGGGWQDQAGAIFRGIKLIETAPGLLQKPTLRWLPPHLFDRDYANRLVLLYYTGITRLAKNILAEIVRGLFLNSPSHLRLIHEISQNADLAAEAVQKCDYSLLTVAIRNSWALNKRLDSGTNPPQVQEILNRVANEMSAVKLLGAGGGGYLLFFAKDQAAALRIKSELTSNPPNARARFVDFALSNEGLQLTRS